MEKVPFFDNVNLCRYIQFFPFYKMVNIFTKYNIKKSQKKPIFLSAFFHYFSSAFKAFWKTFIILSFTSTFSIPEHISSIWSNLSLSVICSSGVLSGFSSVDSSVDSLESPVVSIGGFTISFTTERSSLQLYELSKSLICCCICSEESGMSSSICEGLNSKPSESFNTSM